MHDPLAEQRAAQVRLGHARNNVENIEGYFNAIVGLYNAPVNVPVREQELEINRVTIALNDARLLLQAEEMNMAKANLAVLAAMQADRGVVVRRSRGDLTLEDRKALLPIINQAWEARAGQDEIKSDWVVQFLNDVFAAGWTSDSRAPDDPQEPSPNNMHPHAVPMGRLISHCDGTAETLGSNPHRETGAVVYCKINRDPTHFTFEYVDTQDIKIKYEQEKPDGKKYVNVQLFDMIEAIHARAIVAYDDAEMARFGAFNRAKFLNEVRASLHHWYHIATPYQEVPNLGFEPQHPAKLGDFLCRLNEQVLRLMQKNPN